MADNGPPRSPRSVSFPFRTGLPPASLPSPPSLGDLPPGGAQTLETTSTATVNSPLVVSDPTPDSSPAAPLTDDPRAQYEFFTTPLKEHTKSYSYNPPTDKERGPVLVNKSGMGPRFHELPVDEFLKLVTRASPTAEEREKFEGVDLSRRDVSKFKEKDWYPLLNKTANSVFDAYNGTELVFFDTASHKAEEPAGEDGKKRASRTATFNDAGVYWTTPQASKATKLRDQQINRSKMTPKELRALGKFDARSCDWVAIPVEIKHGMNNTAFYFHDHTEKKPTRSSTHTKSSKPTKASESRKKSAPVSASSAPVTPGDAEGPTHATTIPGEPSQPVSSLQDGGPSTASGTKQGTAKFVRNSKAGEEALAQFAEYILNVLNHQHRIFCYAIYIWQHMARLFCFDRGAVILSTEFSWLTVDSPLHDFLWKVAQMQRVELGYDPTAELVEDRDPTPKHVEDSDPTAKPVEVSDADSFRNMGKKEDVPEPIRKYVRAATAEGIPIYKISITPMAAPPDEGLPEDPCSQSDQSSVSSSPPESSPSPTPCVEPQTRYFLVGKPHFVTDSLFGRCTRGYVAYEPDTGRLCFIKDYWRPYVSGRSRPEHLISERLNSLHVKNVATLICGGDVDGPRAQMTQWQDMLDHLTVLPVPLVHFRMATEEIGLPLEEFTNFRELARVFHSAIQAHFEAWTKGHVLHRDISIGNILIDPITRRGILIDWDLCRFEWELALGPTEPERTGTWEFKSALSLYYPRKPLRLSDDLESFIHAFRYLVLKYHVTTTRSLRTFIQDTFEDSTRVCGILVGGETKLAQMQSAVPPFQVLGHPILEAVLNDFHNGCRVSYQQLDLEKMQEMYGVVEPKLTALQTSKWATVAVDTDFEESLPIPPEMPILSTETSISTDRVLTSQADRARVGEAAVNAPEPCAVTGFLAHHAYLTRVLERFQVNTVYEDKAVNQFKFRRVELNEDVYEHTPRTSTRGISAMSMSTRNSDLIPSNLPVHNNIGSSGGSVSSVGGSYVVKRALEAQVKVHNSGAQSPTSASGVLSRHDEKEEVGEPEATRGTGENHHPKRRRLY